MRKYVEVPNEEAELANGDRSLNWAGQSEKPFSGAVMGGGSAAPDAPCDGFVSLFWNAVASGSRIGTDAQQC